jgi:ribosomal protein S18 acetylase RimI-like enzyme
MLPSVINLRLATALDVDALAPLFDAYRQFYGQTADLDLAKRFLAERTERSESTIFVAEEGAVAVGFTQLYPSFSSARAARIYVLNDLYVAPSHRRRGVGRLLLQRAAEYGAEQGAVRLALTTMHTNLPAQRLYESVGWKLDEQFRTYTIQTAR